LTLSFNRSKLKAVGYATRQKLVVSEVFQRAKRPLTVTEVCRLARRKVPSLGVATVYRAIRQFVLAGEVRTVEVPGVPPHYERAAGRHHHFFLCQQCKRLFDLVGCVRGVGALAPSGFRVHEHEIVLYGECASCVARLS
jgi:Fur family transcriptional regulator, ferric uptake regulator